MQARQDIQKYGLTLIQLPVHNTDDPLCNRFVYKVVAIYRFAHGPVVRFEANLLNLARQVEKSRVSFYNLLPVSQLDAVTWYCLNALTGFFSGPIGKSS